jgi:hypothetical protein
MTEPLSVVFQRRAIREAEAIDEWWRARGVRRLLLRATRYHVYYRVREETLEVLALWHATRGTGPGL